MLEHTTNERRGKDLLGMPVFSIAEGRRLGEVTTLLVRREDLTVAAVRIGTALSQGVPIAYGLLRLIGVDAVLVDNDAVLNSPLTPEVLSKLDDAVPGRPVITTGGERIGTISGFWLDTATGHINTFRVQPEAGIMSRLARLIRNDTLDVSLEQVQALGAAALIVTDAIAGQPEVKIEQPI
jgi:sporulation protein YlmC with PRC-barrel domain